MSVKVFALGADSKPADPIEVSRQLLVDHSEVFATMLAGNGNNAELHLPDVPLATSQGWLSNG